MTWLDRYRLRTFAQKSITPLPVCSIPLAIFAARLVRRLDGVTNWRSDVTAEAARTVLGGAHVVVDDVHRVRVHRVARGRATGQRKLTPRIIAVMFQDRVTKFALTVFVFGFTFSLVVLAQIEDKGPQLSALVAVYSSLICLAVFIFMIDHVGRNLRPVTVLTRVGSRGRHVIEHVYPQRLGEGGPPAEPAPLQLSSPTQTVVYGGAGVVLAFDEAGLTALAERNNCLIELVPQVGDFVARGDPLFYVHGGTLSEHALRHSIAIGTERTTEQDPTFAFRIIVDVASKGLSPAINDPTTAVLALDQIHHLLRQVGTRRLDHGRAAARLASFDSSTGHPIGRISSASPSPKSANTAAAACKSRGGSGRCWRI